MNNTLKLRLTYDWRLWQNEYIPTAYECLVGGIGFANGDICTGNTCKKTINLVLHAVTICNEFYYFRVLFLLIK